MNLKSSDPPVRLLSIVTALSTVVLALASGWAIGTETTRPLLAVLALLVLGALVLVQRGALIGILLLAAMNGVPYLNTSTSIGPHFTIQDLAICSLILAAGSWALVDASGYRPSGLPRALSMASSVLLLWWLFTLILTVILKHVPTMYAVGYGRDFLYFGLLLLTLSHVHLTLSEVKVLLAVIMGGIVLFAIGQILTTFGIGHTGSLIHYLYSKPQSGLTRLYADMTDLVVAGLSISLGAVLLLKQHQERIFASLLALLLAASTIATLTRAYWIGMVLAALLVGLWSASRDRSVKTQLIQALSIAGLLGLTAAVVLAVLSPDLLGGNAFLSRFFSGISEIQNGGGTVGVREATAQTTFTYLSGHWLLGLGFIPPTFHYFFGLPEGSIRNTDLGVFGAIVTMGLVGAVLIYVPVVLTLRHCLKATVGGSRFGWLYFGGSLWLAGSIISSITLVTLFSVGGLAMTAVLVAVLAQPVLAERPELVSAPPDLAPHQPVADWPTLGPTRQLN